MHWIMDKADVAFASASSSLPASPAGPKALPSTANADLQCHPLSEAVHLEIEQLERSAECSVIDLGIEPGGATSHRRRVPSILACGELGLFCNVHN